jgi:hypothetical protein
MCAPTSEVTFNLATPAREINVGDPGAEFFDLPPHKRPGVEVTSALFVIGGKTLQLRHLFRMGPLIPHDTKDCASSVLSVIDGLKNLCEARAVGQLTVGWQPPDAGTPFPLTARFEP